VKGEVCVLRKNARSFEGREEGTRSKLCRQRVGGKGKFIKGEKPGSNADAAIHLLDGKGREGKGKSRKVRK